MTAPASNFGTSPRAKSTLVREGSPKASLAGRVALTRTRFRVVSPPSGRRQTQSPVAPATKARSLERAAITRARSPRPAGIAPAHSLGNGNVRISDREVALVRGRDPADDVVP